MTSEEAIRNAEEMLETTEGNTDEKFTAARQRLADAVESAKSACGHLRDKTVDAAKATDNAIRDNPYQFIGIALGVGIAIGLWIGRRNP